MSEQLKHDLLLEDVRQDLNLLWTFMTLINSIVKIQEKMPSDIGAQALKSAADTLCTCACSLNLTLDDLYGNKE